MESMDNRNFKNYLINREMQFQLICNHLTYLIIIVLVTVGIVLSPLIHDMMFVDDLDVQYSSAQTFLTLMKWLLPALIVLFVLFTVHIIYITHRICGPLINFTHTFDRLAEGDLTHKVYIRKGDYLKTESERINVMIDGIAGIIVHLFDHHNKLKDTLHVLKGQIRGLDSQDKIESSLTIINDDLEYISKTLARFKVNDQKTSGT
jgi:methyl-accepting chemotaxis protein